MTSTCAAIVAAITTLVPRLPAHEKIQDATQIEAYATVYNFDPLLIVAVIFHESTFDRHVVTAKANRAWIGLMSVGESHAAEHGYDLFDYTVNIAVGVRLLDEFRQKCGDSPIKFLTAYNRGAGKNLKNCKPSEYARAVIQTWETLRK